LPQISFNEISEEMNTFGAAPQRGYGCSATKEAILHPSIPETVPKNFMEVG